MTTNDYMNLIIDNIEFITAAFVSISFLTIFLNEIIRK